MKYSSKIIIEIIFAIGIPKNFPDEHIFFRLSTNCPYLLSESAIREFLKEGIMEEGWKARIKGLW